MVVKDRVKKTFSLDKKTVKSLKKMQKKTGMPRSRLVDLAVAKAEGKKLYV